MDGQIQTRRAKKANVIDKPTKILREDLQKLKDKFERKGWKFAQNAEEMWSAEKGEKWLGWHGYFSALVAQIDGEETGTHQPGKFSKSAPEITSADSENKKPTAAILRLLSEAPTPDLIPARNYRATLPDLPKDEKKRRAKLAKLLTEYESALKRDAITYDELCLASAEDVEREWSGNEPHYNLQLKINHISYNKQYINAVLEQLGHSPRFESGESPKIRFPDLEWEYPEELSKPETIKAVTVFADTVIPINVSDITPSPFEPQARRRARFKDDELLSLGKSIEQHGLAQPILVRPRWEGNGAGLPKRFEIVFGERRFLAVQRNGAKTINCFAKILSDAQVLELQYEENHRRQENNPLDDAFFFKFLMEKENYTSEELASRLNTSIANVQNKLILNDLIPAAVSELADGLLPLKHAYFLARFPGETQELICKEQYAYKYYDRTEKATGFKAFVEEVDENVTLKLENAPFSITDTRLRIDGLICPNCTQRTGYAPMLFTDLSKGDSCLNKSCYEQKTNVHLRLKRDEVAAKLPNPEQLPIEEKVKEVPLVTDRAFADKKVLGEKLLVVEEFHPEPECEYDKPSVIGAGNLKGESAFFCTEKNCEVHHPQPPAPDLTDPAFVRRVELLTREKVLAKSLEAFSDYKPIWMYHDLVQKLIAELWIGKGVEAQKSIMRIIRDWKELPKAFYSRGEVDSFVASLDKTKQSQIIFLLLFHLNASTDEIKKISNDYARLDYRIIEAEARLELAPESEKELAQDILTITRGGVNDLRKPDFDLDAVH